MLSFEEGELDIRWLGHEVRQIAHQVHVYFGHGHLERVYENAMVHRLKARGPSVHQQWPIAVFDEDGTEVGSYRADLFVDQLLLIELKAARTIAPEHEAQILGYLRAARQSHGMLVNVGSFRFQVRKYFL